MSVLDRSELEKSHLADLHAIASELGIEGYRRLGKKQLIDAILAGGGGADEPAEGGGAAAPPSDDDDDAEASPPAGQTEAEERPRRRGRRLRLRRGRDDDEQRPDPETDQDDGAEIVVPEAADEESAAPPVDQADEESAAPPTAKADDPPVRGARRSAPDGDEEERTGVLDVLPGGSGFMRADPFVHARDDVYVSPAQIRRCELRSGDTIAGPVRPPRRSERYPSLVRVGTVNGRDAEPPAERPHFDELTPVFATEPLETVHGLPIGRGSRVAIGGPPGAGATRLLREVTAALQDDLDVLVLLLGVRPEEVTDWQRIEGLAVAGGGFDRPQDELGQIGDMAAERAKRIVEAGGHAVLVVDGLDALQPPAARRLFGAARNTEEAGSLTVVAATGTADELQRLATTRVVLTAEGSLDAAASGTLRAELLGG